MKFFVSTAFALLSLIQAGGAQQTLSIRIGSTNRSYTLYTPKSYAPGKKLPLVYVLHGFTQTAADISRYSAFNPLADSFGFFAVYPSGISNGWNTNSGFPGGSTADDVGFIRILTDSLIARYGIDADRVYSCGFSAGGFMSHRLACELSDRIAAIASVAGTMSDAAFKACNPGRAVPVLHIHGTSDLVVAYSGGLSNISADKLMQFWVNKAACNQTPAKINIPDRVQEGSTAQWQRYGPCNQSLEMAHIAVNSGGHTWPGSSNSGVGTTNMDFSASAEIWQFFSRFSLNGPLTNIQTLKPNPEPVLVWNGKDLLLKPASSTEASIALYDLSGRCLFSGHPEQFNAASIQTPQILVYQLNTHYGFFSGKLCID
ncbi:MAG: alpha/beta hydrolase family esterase [Bacteroidia bacterium]